MDLVASLRGGARHARPITPSAVRGKVPISNRTKLASRRRVNSGFPPPPPIDDEPERFSSQYSSTDSDGVFFLGMALLMTILFTREWIGDAVPILAIPIAALAFTPLGGYLAQMVNKEGNTYSERYRPPQQYQRGNWPGTDSASWQTFSERPTGFKENDSLSHVSRKAKHPDEFAWGSPRETSAPQTPQQAFDEQEQMGSNHSNKANIQHPADDMKQLSSELLQSKEASTPLSQGGCISITGLTSAAFTSPFESRTEPQSPAGATAGSTHSDAPSMGSSTHRGTQTTSSYHASNGQQQNQTHEADRPHEDQKHSHGETSSQVSSPMNVVAAAVVEVTDAATAISKPASQAVQAAARVVSAATDTAAAAKAAKAAQAAAQAAAAAAASPAAASASTLAVLSSAASAAVESAATAANSAHENMRNAFSEGSPTAGKSRSGLGSRGSSYTPVATSRRSTRGQSHQAATVAEYADARQSEQRRAEWGSLDDASLRGTAADQGRTRATVQSPPQNSHASSAPSGEDGDVGRRSDGRSRVHAAESSTVSPHGGDRAQFEGQGEDCHVVEAVEVLMLDDYEYLQRQRQRIERRKQNRKADQGGFWGAQQRQTPPGVYSAKPAAGQGSWWAGAASSPPDYSSGNQANVRSQVSSGMRTWDTEEVMDRSQQRGSPSPSMRPQGRRSGVHTPARNPSAPTVPAASKRRMNARDVAAAHQAGRVSKYDSWGGTGLRKMGPVGGLFQWMFGAKARARVQDTVIASRRPLMGALMQVFPFLRSWGGFM